MTLIHEGEDMFKKSQQIIKFTQNICGANVEDNSTLFVRVESAITDKDAEIEVPYTHCAMVVKNGNEMRYIEKTTRVFENKEEIKNWKKGHSVDVIYMPKEPSVKIYWGHFEPRTLRDKKSGVILKLQARGSFDVMIQNHEMFCRRIVGMNKVFNLDDFSDRVRSIVLEDFDDIFLSYVDNYNLEYSTFDQNKKTIARSIEKTLGQRLVNKTGVAIEDFTIDAINVFGVEKIEEEIAERKEVAKINNPAYRAYLENKERQDDKAWQRGLQIRQFEREEAAADRAYDIKVREIDSRVAIAEVQSGRNRTTSNGRRELTGEELYKKVISNNFKVHAETDEAAWSGSGFVIDTKNHLAITNAHVAADPSTYQAVSMIKAIFNEGSTDATVVALADDEAGHGEGVDLAILQLAQLPKNASNAEICLLKDVQNGETVYLIGNSKGEGLCITKGVVSDKNHEMEDENIPLLMIDAAANGGNSGGPVYNGRGQIIGVLASGYTHAKGMNFAVPSDYVVEFLNAIYSNQSKQN